MAPRQQRVDNFIGAQCSRQGCVGHRSLLINNRELLHVVLFRFLLMFVVTHEYTHHVTGISGDRLQQLTLTRSLAAR